MEAYKRQCNGLIAFDNIEIIQAPRNSSNKECPQIFEPPTTTSITTSVTQLDTTERM